MLKDDAAGHFSRDHSIRLADYVGHHAGWFDTC
jgi:hypothetical protein